MEIKVMLQEVLSRFPHMEMIPGRAPIRVASTLARGIEEMQVFTAAL